MLKLEQLMRTKPKDIFILRLSEILPRCKAHVILYLASGPRIVRIRVNHRIPSQSCGARYSLLVRESLNLALTTAYKLGDSKIYAQNTNKLTVQ